MNGDLVTLRIKDDCSIQIKHWNIHSNKLVLHFITCPSQETLAFII